jgi:hypothetical protein
MRLVQIHSVDPLRDPRWEEFVRSHPRSTVFHSSEWLRILADCYGYVPVAYTTSPEGYPLENAILFCQIRSWITGNRLVSLPFSDHCEPLVETPSELQLLLEAPLQEQRRGEWKYVEVRPLTSSLLNGMERSPDEYVLHLLDLRPSHDELYRRLHKSSVRRKLRRAEREGLALEEGRSASLLLEFFRLHVKTRRRHRLPPQPLSWFEKMLLAFSEKLTIRVARKGARVIAALVTLETHNSFVYKYGASDAEFHEMGGMPFLGWSMILAAKQGGHRFLDLGRSARTNSGLIAFKNHLGATEQPLRYMRVPARRELVAHEGVPRQLSRFAFRCCPDSVLIAAGKWFYPHIG